MRRLRILTWHIHGSYLYYLAHLPHDFILPVAPGGAEGYAGRTASFPWPSNVYEVPKAQIKDTALDGIIFQSKRHYLHDQYEILSERQLRLPRIYLEHDPPRGHPTDTLHPVQDENILLVHCTHFNRLMWDNGITPSTVIEHGVTIPLGARYTGRLPRGIVVVNNLKSRGRRLGADIYAQLRTEVPLDLIGMGSSEVEGGLGEVPPREVPAFIGEYRLFFNPIRYTSLGLAILEAMMVGLPIIGLKTTELASVIENGVSGYLALNPRELVDPMLALLSHPEEARRLGEAARQVARTRYGIDRFVKDWCAVLADALGGRSMSSVRATAQPSLNSTKISTRAQVVL